MFQFFQNKIQYQYCTKKKKKKVLLKAASCCFSRSMDPRAASLMDSLLHVTMADSCQVKQIPAPSTQSILKIIRNYSMCIPKP